jgi:Ser/Thr protein kinase RdoA (MazF antagonist)
VTDTATHLPADDATPVEPRRVKTRHGKTTKARLANTAAQVAADCGLGTPHLVRADRTGLYRCGDVAVRVGQGNGGLLQRRALAAQAHGIAVPAIVDGPYLIDGLTVTLWQWIDDTGDEDWERVGATLRHLHDTTKDAADQEGFAAGELGEPLREHMAGHSDAMRDVCGEDAMKAVGRAAGRINWTLNQAGHLWGEAVCHGDMHRGNILFSDNGPVVCGWEMCSVGPGVWDLAAAVNNVERFGGDQGDLDALIAGYGLDPRDCDEFRELVSLRELMLVSDAAQRAHRGHQTLSDEARLRAETVLDAGDQRTWARY